MGEIVAFKMPAASKRRLRTDGESAEILFFTGVRYVPVQEQAKLLRNIRRRRPAAARKQAH
jgi:hypothetical protein